MRQSAALDRIVPAVALVASSLAAGVSSGSVAHGAAAAAAKCPGQTSTATPTTTAYFSDPTAGAAAQERITKAMVNLICAVTPYKEGSAKHGVIDLAEFRFVANTPDGYITKMVKALEFVRDHDNAEFQVALNGSNATRTPAKDLRKYLKVKDNHVNKNDRSVLKLCGSKGKDNSCNGDYILHAKLLFVSSVGPAAAKPNPAILVTSQNLIVGNQDNAYNNAAQIVGNEPAYTSYNKYFSTLLKNHNTANLGSTLTSKDSAAGGLDVKSYYFPRNHDGFPPVNTKTDTSKQDKGLDTVASLLANLVSAKATGKKAPCLHPGSDAGISGRTSLQVAMADFRGRPLIVSELDKIAAAGCRVQIIYSQTDKTTQHALHKLATNAKEHVSVRQLFAKGGGRCVYLHSKYALISGDYAGHNGQDIVITGSENWLPRSLHNNDESMIKVTADPSTEFFSLYSADFTDLYGAATATPTTSNVGGCHADD